MTPTETLRQCRATLSLIDRSDCKDDAVWQKVVDTQAEVDRVLRTGPDAEGKFRRAAYSAGMDLAAALCDYGITHSIDDKDYISRDAAMALVCDWRRKVDEASKAYKDDPVLRDGEKQEPVAYCVPDAKGKPLFGKGWMFSPLPQLKATMPLYTHPAPSLPAVGAVSEDYVLVPKTSTSQMDRAGEDVYEANGYCECGNANGSSMEAVYAAMIAFAPQPAAAPSGDVERDLAKAISVGYEGGTMTSQDLGGTISLHYQSSAEAENAFNAISNAVDVAITATKE